MCHRQPLCLGDLYDAGFVIIYLIIKECRGYTKFLTNQKSAISDNDITGHSDYKAMKPYIDIADDIKANAMSKFNQL